MNITGLCFDSRKAKTGDVFFAIKGQNFDGNKFIVEVLDKGIQLVITDDITTTLINPQKIILVEDAKIALSVAAGIFYPKLPQILVAATGTNGKTSVTSYCRQLYSLLGKSSSNIGTLGIECSENIEPAFFKDVPALTTFDSISLRYVLHNMAEYGINYIAFEASSHGLHQSRLNGLKVAAACLTSFSQDHLDYHQTMDDYLVAKLKLFTDNLILGGIAVISSEIKELTYIKNYLTERDIKFVVVGLEGDLKITKIQQSVDGQNVNLTFNGREYNFITEIIGSFQASNLLIAAMLVHHTGFEFTEIVKKLSMVTAVKGRLERITSKNSSFHVFVDYAHTHEALENSLNELKIVKLPHSKLKVIFGCGGNRDTKKRPLMGRVAGLIADEIIVTDDNPRNENPGLIRQEIMAGMKEYSHKYIEIEDRKEAIITTIKNLQDGDILLIAGKGHEDYQIIGDKKLPFSDSEIASSAIKSLI